MILFDYTYDLSTPGYGGSLIHATIEQAAQQLMTLSTPYVFVREQGTARWWRFERDGGFSLMNDAPRPRRPRFENSKQTQRLLLTGLDCIPGQNNLFPTDGTN